MSHNEVPVAAARLNATLRWHGKDKTKVAKARNALVAAHTERAIREALKPADSNFKPLAKADRERLAALLLND